MGYAISAEALKEALISASCTPLEKGIFIIDETHDAYKALEDTFNAHIPNRYAPVEVLMAYRKKIAAGS